MIHSLLAAVLLCLSPDLLALGADPTDVADSGPAFRAALAQVNPSGGVLIVPPGRFRILATAKDLCLGIQSNVTLRGTRGLSVLSFESDDGPSYREGIRIGGDGVSVEDITLTRKGAFSGVLLKLYPSNRLKLRDVTINGCMASYGPGVHAIELAPVPGGVSDGVTLDGCAILGCQSALFTTDAWPAMLRNFAATGCLVSGCGQGLDFNAPNGVMEDIRLDGCSFADIGSDIQGFGVGLARVKGAAILSCRFARTAGASIHAENGTSKLTVAACDVADCGSKAFASVNLINAANRVVLVGNHFDAPAVPIPIILVATGGDFPVAGDVIIQGNTFNLGTAACGIEAYGSRSVAIMGNLFVGAGVKAGATNFGVSVRHATGPLVRSNTFRGLGQSLFEDPARPAVNGDISGNVSIDCGAATVPVAPNSGGKR